MRWLCRVGLPLCLLVFTSLSHAAPIEAQDDASASNAPRWVPLGPSGVFQAGDVTVSSGWPADPFLLVSLHGSDARYGFPSAPPAGARSFDGGNSWEPVPELPAGPITALWTERYGRVLLQRQQAPEGPSGRSEATTLARSTDNGLTWKSVLALPARPAYSPLRADPIVMSPNVYWDAHIVVLNGWQALQSYDAGATWEPLDPAPGQRMGTVLFSPDVASDGTLYLTATSGPFRSIGGGPSDPQAAEHHEKSAGILASYDNGHSWQPIGDGPQIEGDPYRQVATLAISPTFARDGTMFAYAWGPWLGDNPKEPRGPHTALFRSQDRGQTWISVWEPFSRTQARRGGVRSRAYVEPVLSPAYAENGLVLATQNGSSGSPASGHCNQLRSEDFGQTWTSRNLVSSYGGCWDLRFAGGDPTMAIWRTSSSGSGGWSSTRRGFSLPFWRGFGPRVQSWSPSSSAGPTVAPDGAIFTYGTGGVWMLSDTAQATNGRLPCVINETEPYAAARLAAPYAQPWLGCPVGPPHMVQIRERRLADTRALWTEDDDTRVLLTTSPDRQYGEATFLPKADSPWSGPPDRVFQAEIQRFEGGLILWLPSEDGHDGAMLVAARFWWQQVGAP